jgi:hypothetical protein
MPSLPHRTAMSAEFGRQAPGISAGRMLPANRTSDRQEVIATGIDPDRLAHPGGETILLFAIDRIGQPDGSATPNAGSTESQEMKR